MPDDGYLIHALPTEQSNYDGDLYVAVSKSALSQARKMLVSLISPKPYTLSAPGSFNRASTYIKLDDGAGNLYKITPNDLYTLIKDLGTTTQASTDWIRFGVNGPGYGEYQLSISSFASNIFGYSSFNTAADARITNQQESIDAVEIKATAEGEVYGYLTLERFGNIVTGFIEPENNTGSQASYNSPVTANFRPSKRVIIDMRISSLDPGYIVIETDGTVTIVISGDLDSYNGVFPIAYSL